MLKVTAEFFIKETESDFVMGILQPAVESTRKEIGNISYEVFQDSEESTHLTFIEEWQSKEALDEHMKTAHFKKLIEDITKAQTKEPVIKIYTKLF